MIRFKSKIVELYDFRNVDLSGVAEPFSMSDDDMTRRIDRIRKKHAATAEADAVMKEDFATVSCTSGVPKFNKDNIVVRVGAGLFSTALEEGIVGMRPNEERTVDVDGTAVKVRLVKATRRVLAPLTDAAVAGYGIEGVSTVEALKKHIFDAEKREYIEENAEGIASYVSEEAAKRSRIELDADEIAEERESGLEFADGMIRSAGLDRESSTDEEFMEAVGRTKNDFIEFLVSLTADGLAGAVIGAHLMNEAGVEVTQEAYEKALAEYREAMGVSEEEARRTFSFRKFEKQQASNYYFEQIVRHVEEYLNA